MEKLQAVFKKQGEELPTLGEIANDLKALQDYVGGYIETVTLQGGIVLICDEEGLIKASDEFMRLKQEPDFWLSIGKESLPFFGNILFLGVSGEEFRSLTQEEKEQCCNAVLSGRWE